MGGWDSCRAPIDSLYKLGSPVSQERVFSCFVSALSLPIRVQDKAAQESVTSGIIRLLTGLTSRTPSAEGQDILRDLNNSRLRRSVFCPPECVANSCILGLLVVVSDVLWKGLDSRAVILSLFLRVQKTGKQGAKFLGFARPLVHPAATFRIHGGVMNAVPEWCSVSSFGAREPRRMLKWHGRPQLFLGMLTESLCSLEAKTEAFQ